LTNHWVPSTLSGLIHHPYSSHIQFKDIFSGVSFSEDISKGTFSFTGKDGENCDTSEIKTVTEGSFRGVFK
jgi:hypothetical protein